MSDQLIPDAAIPKQVEADGRRWLVIDRMQNFHHRALLLPVGGGAPRWFSNAELRAALGLAEAAPSAQAEPRKRLSDADIKGFYVERFGEDGWLGEPGSWFIEGFKAGKAAPPTAQAEPHIDPLQNPMRPAYFMNYAKDEAPAEMVLRKLACWLGVGGYNAPTVDADLFHRKIVDGIESLLAAAKTMPAAAQAEPQEPLTDEHISALYVSGWGAYCSRASFIAIFREAERVHRIGKQESE